MQSTGSLNYICSNKTIAYTIYYLVVQLEPDPGLVTNTALTQSPRTNNNTEPEGLANEEVSNTVGIDHSYDSKGGKRRKNTTDIPGYGAQTFITGLKV